MFFQDLSSIIAPGVTVTLVIGKQDEMLTVSVCPQIKNLKDEAQNCLQPVVVAGTASELDNGFFEIVKQPIRKVCGLLTNMKAYEDACCKAETERREAKDRERQAGKIAERKSSEYNRMYNEAVKKMNDNKPDEALKLLNRASTVASPTEMATLKEEISDIKAKCLQQSLF